MRQPPVSCWRPASVWLAYEGLGRGAFGVLVGAVVGMGSVMAVPAFIFVETFGALLPYGLGFAAGAMVWMVFAELLPDARKDASNGVILVMLALSAVLMMAFQILLS